MLMFNILNVWKKFEMEKMKDYHGLYLKRDILLVVDEHEKLRNTSLKTYGLSPSHYLSAIGLSWYAILEITKIELQLIPDPDIFFKKSIYSLRKVQEVELRVCNRYSKANKKYLKSYDPKLESKHIIYLAQK